MPDPTRAQIQPPPQRDMQDLPEAFKLWCNQVYSWLKQQLGSFTNFSVYSTPGPSTQLGANDSGYILIDASAGAVGVILPAASIRKRIHIKKIDASANNAAYSTGAGDNRQGLVGVFFLTTQYQSVTLYSDGKNTWYIESTT